MIKTDIKGKRYTVIEYNLGHYLQDSEGYYFYRNPDWDNGDLHAYAVSDSTRPYAIYIKKI